jgi:hypothetical protein
MRAGKFIKILAISALLVLVIIPATANANSAYLGYPGDAITLKNGSDDVAIERQVMQVWLHRGFAEVENVYQLYNSGDTQELMMGLPEAANKKIDLIYGVYNFRAYVDGNEVDVKTAKTRNQEVGSLSGNINWHVHNVFISKGQRRIVVQRYWIRMVPSDRKITIPLMAAGTWKGSIGRADYTIHLMSGLNETSLRYPSGYGDLSGKFAIQPGGFTFSKGEIKWKLTNFVPDQDMVISVFPRGKALISSIEASGALEINGKKYEAKYAADSDPATSWGIEGANANEWLTFNLDGKRWVRELRIIPGYTTFDGMFMFYNRPKDITLQFSDGSSQQFTLRDDPDMQYLSVRPIQTNSIKLTVDDVYKGIFQDVTYVSEVEFGDLHTEPKLAPAKWKIGLNQEDSVQKQGYSLIEVMVIITTILIFLFVVWQVVLMVQRHIEGRKTDS